MVIDNLFIRVRSHLTNVLDWQMSSVLIDESLVTVRDYAYPIDDELHRPRAQTSTKVQTIEPLSFLKVDLYMIRGRDPTKKVLARRV